MILSVSQTKELLALEEWSVERIERKLKAIESVIRQYTHNNFQQKDIRSTVDIVGGVFVAVSAVPFDVGDTVQVTQSGLNDGLYTVQEVNGSTFNVHESVKDERSVLVTKIKYPDDVVDCCINLLDWEARYRQKVGIKSETLSRHSVTYEDSSQMFNGYPVGLLNALNLYKKARF